MEQITLRRQNRRRRMGKITNKKNWPRLVLFSSLQKQQVGIE